MESVGDLLGRYSPKQPDEATALKRYIAKELGAESSITVQQNAIVITVRSAALASTLRLRTPALQKAANTTKRLVFRIG